jgi:TolA-binding protein
LGVSYDRLQNPAKSEQYLNEVQLKFPESTAAKLAKSYKINR